MVGSIGEVVASLLTVAQFESECGPGWALADGRDVSGSRYHAITGETRLPDLRERVLRMSLSAPIRSVGGSDAVTLTISNLPNHAHGIHTRLGDSSTMGYSPIPPTGNPNNWSWQGDHTTAVGEDRPFSIVGQHGVVNFFVKVN